MLTDDDKQAIRLIVHEQVERTFNGHWEAFGMAVMKPLCDQVAVVIENQTAIAKAFADSRSDDEGEEWRRSL
jgi:hypothetical protein